MDIEFLQTTPLFKGMEEEELRCALLFLQAEEKSYDKGETIFHAGDVTEKLGLVLEGSVTIESNDAWGNRSILSHVERMQLFAETYALLPNEPLLVDAVTNVKSRILFLRFCGVAALSSASQPWALKLMSNLLEISARKNLHLAGRSFHTASKTVRGRVMAYLHTVSLQKQSRAFDIPFDRQQLADYLNVERTALSKELGKMQDDGLIQTKKSHFILC